MEGVGAQACRPAGSHEVADAGAPGQGLVERGQSWAHSSQEGVTVDWEMGKAERGSLSIIKCFAI